jgi:hypothetical protein
MEISRIPVREALGFWRREDGVRTTAFDRALAGVGGSRGRSFSIRTVSGGAAGSPRPW